MGFSKFFFDLTIGTVDMMFNLKIIDDEIFPVPIKPKIMNDAE